MQCAQRRASSRISALPGTLIMFARPLFGHVNFRTGSKAPLTVPLCGTRLNFRLWPVSDGPREVRKVLNGGPKFLSVTHLMRFAKGRADG